MIDPIVVASISAGISGFSALVSISAIVVSRLTAKQLKSQDISLDRKKFVATLWDKMTQITQIDPNNADEGDVQFALNTLELVAICWINELVDKHMIVIVFGDTFVLRTREIAKVPKLPIIQRTGDDLLQKEYPVILRVEDEIQKILTTRKTGIYHG